MNAQEIKRNVLDVLATIAIIASVLTIVYGVTATVLNWLPLPYPVALCVTGFTVIYLLEKRRERQSENDDS